MNIVGNIRIVQECRVCKSKRYRYKYELIKYWRLKPYNVASKICVHDWMNVEDKDGHSNNRF